MACSRPNSLISIEYLRLNWLKTISLTAAHTQVAYTGFVLERSFAGFPQLEKKCHIKFTLARQMGHLRCQAMQWQQHQSKATGDAINL